MALSCYILEGTWWSKREVPQVSPFSHILTCHTFLKDKNIDFAALHTQGIDLVDEVLDEILYRYIEKNRSCNDITRALKNRVASSVVTEVIRKVDHNEYKRRQTPPILRVSEKAWFGRRMPITNRFLG